MTALDFGFDGVSAWISWNHNSNHYFIVLCVEYVIKSGHAGTKSQNKDINHCNLPENTPIL